MRDIGRVVFVSAQFQSHTIGFERMVRINPFVIPLNSVEASSLISGLEASEASRKTRWTQIDDLQSNWLVYSASHS